MARVVFPIPPAPVMVTKRFASSPVIMVCISSDLPVNVCGFTGRFDGEGAGSSITKVPCGTSESKGFA